MKEIFLPIINWYMDHITYYSVCLLMAIESSFIPFPSEIVVPPAAWKVASGELNMALVLFSATLGAIIGALFNYYIALHLGRKVIYKLAGTRLAHLMLINAESVEKSEKFFLKYGAVSTFVGRLIPAIRQLISLPAGLARMKMAPFLFYTTLGALIWNIVLALMGYYLFSQKELLEKYYHLISIGGLVLGLLLVGYLLLSAFRKKKTSDNREPDSGRL
jgi:membrane protein DedA with SNARE-associated domain